MLASVLPTTLQCPVDHQGNYLVIRRWKREEHDTPQSTPILIVPDLWQVSADFTPLAELLADEGFSVYCYDSRGYGESPGVNLTIADVISDVLQICALARKEEEGHSPILLSQGIGSLIALHLVQSHSQFVKNLVITAPILVARPEINPYRLFFLRLMARFYPRGLVPDVLLPRFINQGNADKKITSLLTIELIAALSQSPKLLRRMSQPLLVLVPSKHGGREDLYKKMLSRVKVLGHVNINFINDENYFLLNSQSQETLEQVSSSIVALTQNRHEEISHELTRSSAVDSKN